MKCTKKHKPYKACILCFKERWLTWHLPWQPKFFRVRVPTATHSSRNPSTSLTTTRLILLSQPTQKCSSRHSRQPLSTQSKCDFWNPSWNNLLRIFLQLLDIQSLSTIGRIRFIQESKTIYYTWLIVHAYVTLFRNYWWYGSNHTSNWRITYIGTGSHLASITVTQYVICKIIWCNIEAWNLIE